MDVLASTGESSKAFDDPADDDAMDEASRSVGEDTAAGEKEDISLGDQDEEDSRVNDEDETKDDSPSLDKENQDLASGTKQTPKKSKHRPKIFQDAITVFIPVDVTADLKIAIQRTRTKRIKSIYKRFSELKKEAKKPDDEEVEKEDAVMDDEDNEENKDKEANKTQAQKKKKKLAHVPQPDQYGSVLDYLEAKYVKGVMLGDEDVDGENMDDGSEGQGSVYSGGSFLDDRDLQRDVAEQVMANTTHTKLELEEDDADFFVNVGNLEVEDDQYGDHYDPLQDKEQATKKRKKPQTAASSSGSPTKKKKAAKDAPDSGKSKKSTASSATQKGKKKTPKGDTGKNKEVVQAAKKAKSRSDALFKKVIAIIKKMTGEELPRRRTKLKVALTCPPSKKPGDDITFSNPHNPGQRLRVKVPKDCFPGGTFKVSVPVKQQDGDDDDTDHNTFSREFQELLDDYARAFDDWCQAQSEVDKKFALYKEKQHKFDKLEKEFPQPLLTPVDANYLKKLVRRARQNRSKRKKTAAALQQETAVKEAPASEPEEEEEQQKVEKRKTRIVEIPTLGTEFSVVEWDTSDFIA